MEQEVFELLRTTAPWLVAAGAAWGGAKQALNGTRKRVERMEALVDKHIEAEHQQQVGISKSLTRVETKVDYLATEIKVLYGKVNSH